jgi:aspartate aminotransferase
VAALREDQEIVQEMVKVFQKRCQYVLGRLREFPEVTCPEPAGAFYLFPNFSACYGKKAGERVIGSSVELAEYLMEEAHVAVIPGSPFGEDRCIRLSYPLGMDDLKEGLDRMFKALSEIA